MVCHCEESQRRSNLIYLRLLRSARKDKKRFLHTRYFNLALGLRHHREQVFQIGF